MAKDANTLIREFVKATKTKIPENSNDVCFAVAQAHLNIIAARKALTPTAQHYGDAVEALPKEIRVSHQTVDNHPVAVALRQWLIEKDGEATKTTKGNPQDIDNLKKQIADKNARIKKLTAKTLGYDDMMLELQKEKELHQRYFAMTNLIVEIARNNGIDVYKVIRQYYEWNGVTYIDRRTGEMLQLGEKLGDIDEQ